MTTRCVVRPKKPVRRPKKRVPVRPCPPKPAPPVAVSVRRLLHSVAKEELALAGLIAAEAKKTSKLAKRLDMPFSPREAVAHQKAVAAILRASVAKEKLLLDKLRIVIMLLNKKKLRR